MVSFSRGLCCVLGLVATPRPKLIDGSFSISRIVEVRAVKRKKRQTARKQFPIVCSITQTSTCSAEKRDSGRKERPSVEL